MEIDQQTIAEFVQLGGQYAIPVAALLRAIYSGWRGHLPEGLTEIGIASVFAGLTTIVDGGAPNWQTIVLEVMGNTIFMAGLLSFIVVYLLRQPDRGRWFDSFVGGLLGLAAWTVWVYLLGNPFPWWTFPLGILVGVVGFILLRLALRVIARLVRIATYFLVAGVIFIALGGGLFLLQQVFFNTPAG